MESLANRSILLGVTGGVAAYKSAELVRALCAAGAVVRVAMSRGAEAFITPLTLQALSGHRVHTALLDSEAEAGMGHIELARWAERVVVAPASANFIARLAAGMADDLLTTVALATEAPLILAPAMNHAMWRAAATRENVQRLRARGVLFHGPEEGPLACGEAGPGRMVEPTELVRRLVGSGSPEPLAGSRVVVTAGPTREAFDPVRYLSNRSSGRMGFAVAAAAAEAGAEVVLVSGPVALPTPPGVARVDVETAEEMAAAVADRPCDLFIGCAAVADYRPAAPAAQKIKKGPAHLALELERTPDILATVARRRPAPFTVGFAAETEAVAAHAREKLAAKGLDLIAANRVGSGVGFETEENALELFWPGGGCDLGHHSKEDLARRLIGVVVERYRNREKREERRDA